MIVDLFAGPGGWSEGLRSLGLRDIGLEWDDAACRTRAAAGHLTVRCDVAQYPVEPFIGKAKKLIGSPPCPTWSLAGRGSGRAEVDRVHAAVEACRAGWTDEVLTWEWADVRTPLILQPLRWAWGLRDGLEWVACEQVPPALGVWQHMADVLRSWGFRADARVLCAADFGVPQTRERAFLLAHGAQLRWPEPTHAERPEPSLFGRARREWVSMQEALGDIDSFRLLRTNQRTSATGGYYERTTDRPSPTLTANTSNWYFRGGNQANACRRPMDQPAPTLVFGHAVNEIGWVPGPEFRVNKEGRQVTVEEATILAGFRRDYPFQGKKGKQFEQVGNVVCPPVAAAIIGALEGLGWQGIRERAA